MAQSYVKNVQAEYGDIRVYVNSEPWGTRVEIYALAKRGAKQYVINQGKNGLLYTEYKEGVQQIKPLLSIPTDVYYALASILKDVVPPIEKNAVDAELRATKYHLEDLRTLLRIGK